jgi:hypothetical protein
MKFLKYLLVSFMLLLPALASADSIIKPPGKTMWEMHVMGNGPVIASILESVKLVIAPDGGGGGFRSLLLFMALTGFCILAIQAGFNPGQNLFKMFGYLFVVWVVSLTSTQMKAHMLIMDPVSHTETAVMNVPAVVAIPAAVVSGVGHYLTLTIQQAFSTASDNLQLTDAGFDIFGKIQSDLDQYTIARPELQRSMAAFVTDCTIPAIAQHRLSAQELYTSGDLLTTLAKAKGDVFLTRYYAPAPTSEAPTTSIGLSSDLVTCTEAYAKISVAMTEHAQQMLNASTQEWTRSGVMVPFEQVLQTYVEAANIGKGPNGSSYGRPTGMITQKALVNTLGGDFRTAAIQTGNSEILMGLQISQAEQSQKSGWVTSAAVFKNMMGYVYTTLQAFIFAIVPIVVVALLIPGMGKKIFVNYGQILVWLTLWEPMLSIINYLVTLFRLEGVRNAVADGGGITAANSWVISEGANNMVIAASFLGTMVPILCWGLVTGAMAFNEFITHGIGSSFAMQAGAAAATGSVGLNSMSMNSMSSNKFDTAQKSTVGSQSVMAHETAGILTTSGDMGGHEIKKDGSSIGKTGSLVNAAGDAVASGKSVSTSLSSTTGATASSDLRMGSSDSKKVDQSLANHRETGDSSGTTGSHQDSTGTGSSTSKTAKEGQSGKINDQATMTTSMQSGASMGGGGAGGAGGKGGGLAGMAPKTTGNLSGQQATVNSSDMSAGIDKSAGTSTKADSSTSIGNNAAHTQGNGMRETLTAGRSHSEDSSAGLGLSNTHGISKGSTSGQNASSTSTASQTQSSSFNWANAVSRQDVDAAENLQNAGLVNMADARAQVQGLYSAVEQDISSNQAVVQSAAANLAGAGTHSGGFGLTDAAGTGADTSALDGYRKSVESSTAIVESNVAGQNYASASFMNNNLAGSQSLLADQMSFGKNATAGGAPFATNNDTSFKKTGLAVGAAASAAASLAGNPLVGQGMRAGGAAFAAGGVGAVATGAVGVTAAAAGGWYLGRGIQHAIGQERVDAAMEPVMQKLYQYTDPYLMTTPSVVLKP